MLTSEQVTAVRQWLQAKDTAATWAEHERNLRNALCATLFAGTGDGTHRIDIDKDNKLKLVKSTTWSVQEGDALTQAVNAVRGLQGYTAIPETMFGWKPSLKVKVYNNLPQEVKLLFAPALTSKPAAPQLEVEAPKRK